MDFPASPTIGQRYTWAGKTWEYNGEAWALVAGGATATPGGSSTQIQYNDGGILGGDANFTWDKNTDILTLAAGEVRQTGNIRFKPTGSSTMSLIVEPTHSFNTSSLTSRAYDFVQGGTGGGTGDGHSISISATGGASSNYLHVDKYGTGAYSIYKSIAIGWGPATGMVSNGTAIYMQANTSTGALTQVVIGGTAVDASGAKLLISGGTVNATGYLVSGTNINTLYASAGHTHTLNDLTDATITGPTSGQVLSYNGSQWVNSAAPGVTNLSWTASTRTIASDTGNDAIISIFTPTDAGLTPASGGGTANFLRADGTWATPAETGQISLQFQDEGSNLGSAGTVDTLDFTGSNLTATRTGNKVTVAFTGSIGSGITYTYSSTAPGSPNPGDEWVDSDEGILYKYVSDGNTSQWVDFSGSGAPVFTSTLPGVVPASGGGTTNFLRADGTWVAPAGTGTVTSVGLSLPAIFNVTNSPVTTTGTLTGTLASQTQNLVFASPNGSSGAPTFRALVAADVPTLNQNTTGTAAGLSATLVATSGGTGQSTYATGDILYASAPNTLSKLAAGTNTHVLTLAGGVPTWAAPTGGGATNLSYDAATRVLSSDTGTDATLPLFTSTDAGLVPLSGGGTSNYLRADGTWATPPGGSASPGGSTTQLQYNNAGAFGGITNVTSDGTDLTAATLAGNLTFTGNSRRILLVNADNTGNMTGFQSSTTNGATTVNAYPNGTSTISAFRAWNNSAPTAHAFSQLYASTNSVGVYSSTSATADGLPFQFAHWRNGAGVRYLGAMFASGNWRFEDSATELTTAGTANFYVNYATSQFGSTTSSVIGVGRTPSSTWNATNAVEIGQMSSLWSNGSGANIGIASNARYLSGTGWTHVTTNAVGMWTQAGTDTYWQTAPSATAGTAAALSTRLILALNGGAPRFQADFSNATAANRFSFQTSTTDGNTTVNILPNGTGNASSFSLYSSSTHAAGSAIQQAVILPGTGALWDSITSGGTGTGEPHRWRTTNSGSVVTGMMLFPDGNFNVGPTTTNPSVRMRVEGATTITSGKLTTAATVAGYASLNLPHGTAPSAPADGDVWTTTAGIYVRVNGGTVGPLGTGGGGGTPGGSTTQLQYNNAGAFGGITNVTTDGTNLTALTVTGAKSTFAATAAGYASVNLPHGTAPSSPADGDVWTTTGGLYVRVNGGTVGPLGTGGGATAGGSNKQIQYNNSTAFAGAAGFEWDSATTTLSLASAAFRTPAVAVTYGATTTIDCRTGQLFRVAMTGNITTLTLNNAADGQTINVLFVQDATGGRTVVWPGSFTWVGQVAPLLSTTANYVDMLVATYSATDAVWLCTLATQNAQGQQVQAAGSDTQIQYNNGGTLAGATNMTWNNASQILTLGAASKIQSDFTHATVTNRTFFQSNTTNGQTSLGILPNGTSTASSVSAFNNATPTNAGVVGIGLDNTYAYVYSSRTGSGTTLPFAILVGNAYEQALRIQTNGNVNIGTTTSDQGVKLNVEGSIKLSGSSPRIIGPMSGSAATDLFFQTSATNTFTAVGIIPSGTGTQSAMYALNTSSVTNAGFVTYGITSTYGYLNTGKLGAGSTLPLRFMVDSAAVGTIQTNGNWNIGTTTTDLGQKLSVEGNLLLSGTARRITGDMSNATLSNRLSFQDSTTNNSTQIQTLPNGTSTNSGYNAFNNSTPTNAGVLAMVITNTEAQIASTRTGSGTSLPLEFRTGNTPTAALTLTAAQAATFAGTVTISGSSLTLAASSRILGDFGNATPATRPSFQSNVTNNATWLQVIPNGTATSSGILAMDNATPTNAGFVGFYTNGTVAGIQSGRFGSGTARDMVFYVNSAVTQAFRIFQSTQNVNIGPTATDPSARLRVEGLLLTDASDTSEAGLRLPHGTAPTAPVNGDVWTTTAGMYAQINGATVGPFGSGGSAAGSTGELQYNNAGAFAATSAVSIDTGVRHLRLGDEAANWTITPKTSTSANTAGQALTVRGATANGDASGGSLYLNGGPASAGNSSGGAVIITGANGNGTGGGGSVSLVGGTSSSNSAGSVNITAGASTSSTGGSVVITAGNGYGNPGDVVLSAGNQTQTGLRGGVISFRPGTGSGGGGDGYINFFKSDQSTLNMKIFPSGNVRIGSTNTDPSAKLGIDGLLLTEASDTSEAGLRLPHGTAPTSPTNGDVWTTTAGMYARINGSTVGPLAAATPPGGSTTQVQFNSSSAFAGSSTFTWNDNASYSAILSVGTAFGSAWSNTVLPVSGIEFGDRAAVTQFSGTIDLLWNGKVDSAYAYVARTASGTPALLQVGGGAITLKAAASNPGAGSAITFTTIATARGSDGDLYLNAGRLAFPASQNASTDVNTLDDYEEGTWTPTDASGASLSLTVDNAKYIKVGKLVTITLGSISWPSNASAADAKIGGLPFTSATGGTTCSGGVFAFASPYPGSNYAPVPVLLNPNSTQLLVYDPVNGVGMQNQALATTALYGLSMTYVATA